MDTVNSPVPFNTFIRNWLQFVASFFPRNSVVETVMTSAHIDQPPEAVWQGVLFYEDVQLRPPLLLRMFLPCPVRTDGDKTRVGASVRCCYKSGDLVKSITAVEPPNLMSFDVTEQRLGIEGLITTLAGSYRIHAEGQGSRIELTTRYHGYAIPRTLARPFERSLAHKVHHHILAGLEAKLSSTNSTEFK